MRPEVDNAIGGVEVTGKRVVSRPRPVKVLVAGSFATGKTTLVRAMAGWARRNGVKLLVVPEAARRCPLTLNRSQTALASAWLVGEQIRAEAEAMARDPEFVICDRGVPDILSHMMTIRVPRRDRGFVTSIERIIAAWARSYDLCFWAKADPGRPILPDTIRVVSKSYQSRLEHNIHRAFDCLGLEPVTLPTRSSDRVRLVVETLVGEARKRTEGGPSRKAVPPSLAPGNGCGRTGGGRAVRLRAP